MWYKRESKWPNNFFSMFQHPGAYIIYKCSTLCLKKNIPNIFNSNLKTNYQILTIFGTNIPNTTCHQKTI